MGFLAPAILAGCLAVAVPIWLHLTRRPPDRRQAFPSLMFLDEAPLHATRRRSIRDPLLLALRVLAIVLLVAAFSRPYLPLPSGGRGEVGGVREVVLLLDRSYSMGAADRMAEARTAARGIFAELGEGDRLTLVTFDGAARALGPATRDVAALSAVLDSVAPGEGGTSYATALRLAESILSASPGPRREVVIVSDFVAGAPSAEAPVALPEGTLLRTLAVGAGPIDDLAVADVSLRRAGFAAGERVRVLARVRNSGHVPVEGRAVALTLDGAPVASEAVSLEPGAATTIEFPAFSVASGPASGVVRVDADDLPANDRRYFVAEPRRVLDVLIVEPDGSGPRRGIHLRRALELGRSPRFALRRRTPRSLRAEDFREAGVVILDEVPFPEGEKGARLRSFVEGGGGLLTAFGDRSGGGVPEVARGLLPAGVGRAVSRAEGGSLGRLEYGHPVFSAFRDPGSGDLGAARIERYRRVDEGGMRVLARFDDGSPALLEAEAGLGRSLLWTSTLGDAWNDLPLQPVYLPLLHRLLLHAAAWNDGSPERLVGSSVDPSSLVAPGAPREDPAVLVLPGNTRRELDAGGAPVSLERAGVYEIRDPAAADVSRFAVNVDAEEAGATAVDTAALASGPADGDPDVARQEDEAEAEALAGAADREPGRALWWPLLLAAGVLFLLESVLSNVRPGRSMIGGTR